ncbi:hypothetical protein PCIT_b0946 [Pseudoalteromonas citrea]|uniref:Uncharacterized protein n=2 Tax=Pseudoalteromonas citrea TaxID=43655 RepID=A0AAD4AFE0_9GAMM|nr:hypothetical protein [Pseudoalteromonas citrea]KAF7764858.1 hypothetical protein PCIT_b0946 [Pseudoalteromonas citrea]
MYKNKILPILAFSLSSFSLMAADQVSSYAKKSGYSSCLTAVSDIENFFAKDSNYGSWAFVAKEGTDDQIVNATLELTHNDGSTLVDFTIAPTKDGSCSYTYTRTFFTEKSCMATTKEEYMKNSKYKTEINKNITGFEDPNGAKLLLMTAGTGCIVQKKEVGFRHNKQGL